MSSVLLPVPAREAERTGSGGHTISDGELSPELALVDPDLAAAARMLLPDPVEIERTRPSSPALRTAPPRPLALVEPKPAAAPVPAPARRRRLAAVAAAGVVAVVVGVVGLMLAAQHRAADTAPGSDTSSAALQAQAARTYTWPAVPGAERYEFEILRGTDSVFETTTSEVTLELPARLSLSPGRYTWSVTPVYAKRSGASVGRPVVEATFVVAPS